MNGKGSAPRSCFSKMFKENYDEINWKKKPIRCRACGETKEQKKFTRLNYKKLDGICNKCHKDSNKD